MLRRKAYDRLIQWKGREGHKPLLIRGQRQVGKTFIVTEFSKTYKSYAYVDLSRDAEMRDMLSRSIEVNDIMTALSVRNPDFHPILGNTLLFLDEVQACPWARASLKSFALDGRYDVIASGSLLDVPLRDDGGSDTNSWHDGVMSDKVVPLIPVGYEEHMRMYGLDFEEFLWAKGYDDNVISKVRDCVRERSTMDPVMLSSMNEAFKEFMMVGGMPEAVSAFVGGTDIGKVSEILEKIVMSSYNDISKYSRESDALKIRRCLESIPRQLSETNKKFMYARLDEKGSREGARRYGDALLWVEGSGLGNMCHSLRSISCPVTMAADPDQFKVYMSDTGMLIHMMDDGGYRAMRSVFEQNDAFNEGAIMENVVAECLMKAGIQRNYYIHRKNPGRMELDFVMDLGSETAVIEVKSGKHRESPSLSKTIGDDRFQRRIMLERSNVSVDENGVEHYPLFAAAFVRDMAKPDDWLTGFSATRSSDQRIQNE